MVAVWFHILPSFPPSEEFISQTAPLTLGPGSLPARLRPPLSTTVSWPSATRRLQPGFRLCEGRSSRFSHASCSYSELESHLGALRRNAQELMEPGPGAFSDMEHATRFKVPLLLGSFRTSPASPPGSPREALCIPHCYTST